MITPDYPLRSMNNSKNVLQQQVGSGFTTVSVAMIAVLLMVFIMGLLKIYSPDLGFHLKSAAWILENKQFIYKDPFSYGSSAHQYFDLQWLYQLLIYTLYKNGEAVFTFSSVILTLGKSPSIQLTRASPDQSEYVLHSFKNK